MQLPPCWTKVETSSQGSLLAVRLQEECMGKIDLVMIPNPLMAIELTDLDSTKAEMR